MRIHFVSVILATLIIGVLVFGAHRLLEKAYAPDYTSQLRHYDVED